MGGFMKKFSLLTLAVCAALLLNSCFGSMTLTRKVYKFNKGIENKFARSGVFWLMLIVPVYEACGFLDVFILNLVEFWTGENPLTMAANDVDTQTIVSKGKVYRITATQNAFSIVKEDSDETIELKYNPETSMWQVFNNGELKIDEAKKDEYLSLFTK